MLQIPSTDDKTTFTIVGGIMAIVGKVAHIIFRRTGARLRKVEERVDAIRQNYVGVETLQRHESSVTAEITQLRGDVTRVHNRVDEIYHILLERRGQ